MGMREKEAVNHPSHYNATGRKECIVEMLELFGTEKVITFCELNAYKYHYRHEMKNGREDLDKAKWYEEFAEKLREGYGIDEDGYLVVPRDKAIKIAEKALEAANKRNEEMRGKEQI